MSIKISILQMEYNPTSAKISQTKWQHPNNSRIPTPSLYRFERRDHFCLLTNKKFLGATAFRGFTIAWHLIQNRFCYRARYSRLIYSTRGPIVYCSNHRLMHARAFSCFLPPAVSFCHLVYDCGRLLSIVACRLTELHNSGNTVICVRSTLKFFFSFFL